MTKKKTRQEECQWKKKGIKGKKDKDNENERKTKEKNGR